MYLVGRKGFIVSAIFMLLSIAISPMTNKDGEAADTGLVVPTDIHGTSPPCDTCQPQPQQRLAGRLASESESESHSHDQDKVIA
ncbi:hypothetical protein BDA96_03G262700 [Sorghum bicolor]|uniref:Secreted protein n=2 Tax=Sorghum bicolor TaxID=4558 RepID=A0A921RES4_SORBI|nr:hypothetical protein BDA96_03G262700 [Sorghum bicolor]KXG33027.1 hypothetical protein SORBI_3003G242600 [Sorghum bicolor]